jgi:STE24 endopeptidase
LKPSIWIAVLLFTAWLAPALLHAQTPDVASPAVGGVITEYTLPPDKLQKAEALYRTRVVLFVVGSFYGLAVLILVLALRIAPKFRDLAEQVSRRRFVQALVFAPLLLLTVDVLSLPLSVYGQFLRVDYGLSVQGWPSWFLDWLKGELVGTLIGTLVIFGVYAILRRSPTRWWLYGWMASIPFILLLVLVQPIFIDPLFDKFEPLAARQPQLLEPLEQVMQRGGLTIERSRMFEMQASEKVTTYNAYVTGIGASKRVVVWDNTARELAVPETMFVFGHEQGHYVLNHIWKTLGFSIAGLLIGAYLAYRSIGPLLARYGGRWGIRESSDWASLPALILLFSVLTLIAQPLSANFTRTLEHQADIYGLEVIHGITPDSSQAAAHAFQKLGEKGLTYPAPNSMYAFLLYTHPPIHERLQFAVAYRPWDRGQPMRYIR